ncbi:MAG: hypothetical protein US31_C0001G0002 [Berkelbacteria bacterium GW2011_GWA1_36_9]|uniref:YcfA family protein n=1 Tax=Berkelbacteria bacterium GW2011_GWA1_36_9 TaxID=1618331 RepID=A0A0G0FYF2_9BACT|nr:MAG: hypothetical protein US31_C0001G0002 [Berkelbacteria bacterium GW2011_GWA1_36_9]
MTKIPRVSAKDLIKFLNKRGFIFISQKGSHIKLRKLSPIKQTIIIPNHKIIRPGTLNNILKKVGITNQELIELLRN